MIKEYSDTIENWIANYKLPSKPGNLYDPLSYFLKLGGKRIRPVLAMMGAELFGSNIESSKPAALSVELFHNFTLIHDDIMDAAPLRRGMETVHMKWNNNIAILSGDVLFVKAYQALAAAEPTILPALMNVFNRTAVEVCEGQQMDMDFEKQSIVHIDQYLEMIRLKTSVLLGCALEMGAICANASKIDRKAIYAFGVSIGMAFQIQDDILDLYGNPETFGKQVGGDVYANKKTLLYLKSLENCRSVHQKKEIEELWKLPNSPQKIETAQILYEQAGGKTACENAMKTYYSDAVSHLQFINGNPKTKEALLWIANMVMDRMN